MGIGGGWPYVRWRKCPKAGLERSGATMSLACGALSYDTIRYDKARGRSASGLVSMSKHRKYRM